MINKSKVASYVLASVAGVLFVTGIALLTNEGGAGDNGTHEETTIND